MKFLFLTVIAVETKRNNDDCYHICLSLDCFRFYYIWPQSPRANLLPSSTSAKETNYAINTA